MGAIALGTFQFLKGLVLLATGSGRANVDRRSATRANYVAESQSSVAPRPDALCLHGRADLVQDCRMIAGMIEASPPAGVAVDVAGPMQPGASDR